MEINNKNASGYKLVPDAMLVDNNDLWYVSREICAICRYNLEKREYTDVVVIPEIETNQKSAYLGIHKVGERIVIIPAWARTVVTYNYKTRELKHISLEQTDGILFLGSFVIDENLYLIPYAYRYVVQVNVENGMLCNVFDLDNEKLIEKKPMINSSFCDDGIVYGVDESNNYIYKFDVVCKQINCRQMGNNNQRYSGIAKWKDYLILVDNHNKCILVHEERNKQLFEIVMPKEIGTIEVHAADECLVMEAIDSNYIFIAKTIEELKRCSISSFEKKKAVSGRCCTCSDGSSLYVYNIYDGCLEKRDNGDIKGSWDLIPSEEALFSMISKRKDYMFAKEGRLITLDRYIRIIKEI